jgi:dTDP-4-amino-4,6-dideoxy-D-galactose acyltransferase
MSGDPPCQYLDWDSDFFKRRIARVTANRLTEQTIEQIGLWCSSNRIDCLYFLADADEPETTRLAEDHGFRLVDIRVTLDRQFDESPTVASKTTEGIVRVCQPDDVPALRAIARVNHRETRFYSDGNFSASRCDALYETWIEKSCQGYADIVFVAELDEQPVGYLSCHRRDQAEGQIGLFGIGAAWRGKGLGEKLVTESLRWFAERGAERVIVVTQGRNIAGQRAYQRCGFLTRTVQLWYHRWFERKETGVRG